MSQALRQLRFLAADVSRITNGKWWRLVGLIFSPGFHAVALYRMDRFFYLAFGKFWKLARLLLSPLFFLLRPWIKGCEIHYAASIGPGMLILHPSLGVVVSPYAAIGSHCTFTGGNCVGVRDGARSGGQIAMGDYVLLGVNAVVLGPSRMGSRVTIGAGSVSLHDVPDGAVVGGVPARELRTSVARRAPVGQYGS